MGVERCQEAGRGPTAVVHRCCRNEAIMKRVYPECGQVCMQPANPLWRPSMSVHEVSRSRAGPWPSSVRCSREVRRWTGAA